MSAITEPTNLTRHDRNWFRARQEQRVENETNDANELFNADSPEPITAPAPANDTIARAKEDELVVLGLLNDLEEELFAGRAIPMTGKVIVERDQILYLLDQMRDTLPKAILQAEQIKRQETQIIEEARNRSDQFVARAQREAEGLIEEERIVIKARERAQQIIEQAEDEANRQRASVQAHVENLRREAEQEVEEVYGRLAGHLERILQQLRNDR